MFWAFFHLHTALAAEDKCASQFSGVITDQAAIYRIVAQNEQIMGSRKVNIDNGTFAIIAIHYAIDISGGQHPTCNSRLVLQALQQRNVELRLDITNDSCVLSNSIESEAGVEPRCLVPIPN